jgi:hypothetical protein
LGLGLGLGVGLGPDLDMRVWVRIRGLGLGLGTWRTLSNSLKNTRWSNPSGAVGISISCSSGLSVFLKLFFCDQRVNPQASDRLSTRELIQHWCTSDMLYTINDISLFNLAGWLIFHVMIRATAKT